MGASPHANGGRLKQALRLPAFRAYAVAVERPGDAHAQNTRPLGALLRDVMKANLENFRVFGPDETTSNRLDAVYQASRKLWLAEMAPEDVAFMHEHLDSEIADLDREFGLDLRRRWGWH